MSLPPWRACHGREASAAGRVPRLAAGARSVRRPPVVRARLPVDALLGFALLLASRRPTATAWPAEPQRADAAATAHRRMDVPAAAAPAAAGRLRGVAGVHDGHPALRAGHRLTRDGGARPAPRADGTVRSTMTGDLDPLEHHLVNALRALDPPPGPTPAPPAAEAAWRAQVDSRVVDHAARSLQAQKLGFYTIGSAGHEANAAGRAASRPTDPALLHYRSGGFYLARAGQVGHDGVRDVLARHGGRCRRTDRGRPAQGVRPPRARRHPPDVDDRVAPAAGRRRRLRARARPPASAWPSAWPDDAIVVCSFGDASAQPRHRPGRVQRRALHRAYRGEPLPAAARVRGQRHRDQRADPRGVGRAVAARDGRDCATSSAPTARPRCAARRRPGSPSSACASTARPAVLHLRTVRVLGHAGTDVETAYRPPSEIRAATGATRCSRRARWLVGDRRRTARRRARARVPEARARVWAGVRSTRCGAAARHRAPR